MILVADVALLSAIAGPLLRPGGSDADFWLATLVVPLGPPSLALMIFGFDRPGIVKFWLTGLLAMLFLPAFVVWCDLWFVLAWWSGAWRVGWPWVVGLNGLGLLVLARIVRRFRPRLCPTCGRRALVGLGRPRSGLWWCAACGLKRLP